MAAGRVDGYQPIYIADCGVHTGALEADLDDHRRRAAECVSLLSRRRLATGRDAAEAPWSDCACAACHSLDKHG